MFTTVIFVAIGGLVSFLLPCVTPFGALAACAVLRGQTRSALLVVSSTWAINEIAGFTLFHYPRTGDSYAWAALSLVSALAATVLASWTQHRLREQRAVIRGVVVLAVATLGFELALAGGAFASGRSMGGFSIDIDLLVIETNVLFFAVFEGASLLAQVISGRRGEKRA